MEIKTLPHKRFLIICLLLNFQFFFFIKIKHANDEAKSNYIQNEKLLQNTNHAFYEIKKERLKRNIPIDKKTDPLMVGLIGESVNDITSTSGNLKAKQLSQNANFAVLIRTLLDECGLKEGQTVGIVMSSSFPALNIASILAVESKNCRPFIISSLASSTYGANLYEFSYLDMEKLLKEKGIIQNRSSHISYGGDLDQARSLCIEKLDEIKERHADLNFLYENDLSDMIRTRIKLLENENIDVLMNIGGHISAYGGKENTLHYQNGILSRDFIVLKPGIVPYFLYKNVKVIQLLNIENLAKQYDIQMESSQAFSLFYQKKKTVLYDCAVIIPSCCIMFLLKKTKNEQSMR